LADIQNHGEHSCYQQDKRKFIKIQIYPPAKHDYEQEGSCCSQQNEKKSGYCKICECPPRLYECQSQYIQQAKQKNNKDSWQETNFINKMAARDGAYYVC
jgi:hypothetical protein